MVNAYWKRGTAWYLTGQYDNAITDYTKAIQLSLDDESFEFRWCLYLDRGDAYFKKNQYALAIADYTESIKNNPDGLPPDAHLERGKAFLASWEDGYTMACCYEYTEVVQCKFNHAIADFTEAIRLEKENLKEHDAYAICVAEAYYERGLAYSKTSLIDWKNSTGRI